MTAQRVEALQPPYDEAVQASFNLIMPDGVPPLNIFRTVGNNARVLSRMVQGGLLDLGSVTIAQRELVILRACANCRAEYEWGVHVAAFGEKAGFSAQQIAATCDPQVSDVLWSAEQQVLLRAVDELHQSADLSDEAWTALAAHFSCEQIIEIVMLAGLYHAVSFVVNGLRVEKEPFAPTFPVPTDAHQPAP